MKSEAVWRPIVVPRMIRWVGIGALAVASQSGCGREFYREWANQDVSEAIYEKSRDPRFRLDLFSVEPPAMSRFADPYDPDRPPAPPDDPVAQALSPVPQWPDHRLMMPVEGTGYLAVIEKDAARYSPPPPRPASPAPENPPAVPSGPPPDGSTSPFVPAPGDFEPRTGRSASPSPTAPPPALPGPGASRPNSGTNQASMSPTQVAARPPQAPKAAPASGSKIDDGVRRTATQDNPQPMPTQTPPATPITAPTVEGDPLRTPGVPMDPNPTDRRLDAPVNPRPDLTPRQFRESEEVTSNLSGLFVPENVPINEATAVGLPPKATPSILTMEKAFEVSLLNSRFYQFQVENLYVNALPVTLQRFSFQPQFIAGLSPSTGLVGPTALGSLGVGPAISPVNSFLYSTRETGTQQSTLNLGTVAGVGKAFDTGGRILASFANQLVFNFVGRNPIQPTVRSFIPIQFVQPFLRGGGRAVTLENLTQAERNLLYSIRAFAKFRQEFVVATLVGGGTAQNFGTTGTTVGFTTGGNSDPAIGFLRVVQDAQTVENQVKNLAVFERIFGVYSELIQGENNSGLTNLQVDQIDQARQGARSQLLGAQLNYRNDIDQLKQQYGMPPDTPLVIDRSRTEGFRRVFEEIDKWALSPKRELSQLDGIIARLPQLEDLVIEGRSFINVFQDREDENLEDLLLTAERVALENRLDLMNARAQLYDTWRQIRVSANALKGILNVAVTNQFLTPPTTNNPFGFVDQAKAFSLVFNAELPLVRINERNQFRLNLINYQRQRRSLQNTEDGLKYQLRSETRGLELTWRQFQIAQRTLALSVRTKDQAFEAIIAPPQGPSAGAQGAVQTTNLVGFQQSVVNNENNLISLWYNYQTQRLILYRDLGILPYEEWEAFDELFPSDRAGGAYAAPTNGRPAAVQPVPAATPVGRP